MTARMVLAALLVVGCRPPDHGPRRQAAGAAPHAGGTLHLAVADRISTLDPAIAYDELSAYAVHALFDTLLDYAPGSTELVPRLAARWTISPDARTFTFELRPGTTFEDGVPITAAHVKYALERALRDHTSPFGGFLAGVVGAQAVIDGTTPDCAGITTPSDHALVIQLAAPDAAFVYILTMPFTTPQRAEHVAAAGGELRRTPLATGPYVLAAWDEGERLVLRRNPRYLDHQRNRIDEIEIRERLPADTQFLMFEAGELDAVDKLAAPDYLWLSQQPAWQPYIHQVPLLGAFGSRFNVRVKPFDDRRVRQAFNYALDKHHTTKLMNGRSVPSHGILPPGMAGRDDTLAPYPHDPAKARALLAEAGYPDGLDVTYVTIADDTAELLASSLQGDLAEAGIRVHLSVMSLATAAVALGDPQGPPFMFVSWVGDYPDPSDFLDQRFHSRMIADHDSANASFYANPALDALLDAARAEPDRAKRSALYQQADRLVRDDAPWLWDYHLTATEVTQPYVKDYTPHPMWIRDYTQAWLDLPAAEGAP